MAVPWLGGTRLAANMGELRVELPYEGPTGAVKQMEALLCQLQTRAWTMGMNYVIGCEIVVDLAAESIRATGVAVVLESMDGD